MTIHDFLSIASHIGTGLFGFWLATVLNRLGRKMGEGQSRPPLAEIPLADERDLFMGRNQGGRP